MKNTILFKSKSENTISPIRLQRNGSMKNLNCHVDEPESCDGGRGTHFGEGEQPVCCRRAGGEGRSAAGCGGEQGVAGLPCRVGAIAGGGEVLGDGLLHRGIGAGTVAA